MPYLVLSHDTYPEIFNNARSSYIMVFLTATYTVQDIITTVLPYGLTVECVFAVEQNTCTVFLVLDDREFVIKENFTGEWTFINLPIGRYIVQVCIYMCAC